MAYDPYSYAGQFDYNQDPYGGGGYGYDDYGYGGYGEPYTPTPLPKPDANWVDPVKVNRVYLKKIQKSCIHQGFEGLKENGLFLLEMMVRSISLKKDIFESLVTKDTTETSFEVYAKFLDGPFLEVNDTISNGVRKSIEERLPNNKSLSNLFQCIYTCTGRHDSLIPEEDNEIGVDEKVKESNTTVNSSAVAGKDKNGEKEDLSSEANFTKLKIMKGKSVLLPMPGLNMIQKLQQYPLILKMVRCGVKEEHAQIEEEIISTCCIRLSETYRKSVLMSCKPESVLPLVVVATNNHKLIDPAGEEVGDADLTIVLTSFGKGAVNCMSEVEDSHLYEHTFLLKHLKTKHVIPEESVPPVDPRVAKEIIKMGLFFPSIKTSSEILQDCLSSNRIPTDDEEKEHVLHKRDCGWFSIVKTAYPPSSTHCFDYENFMRKMETERAAMWMEHKRICREMNAKEPDNGRRSLEERFLEVQAIQTGVTGVETENPFEDLARNSLAEASLKSFTSSINSQKTNKNKL